MERRLYSRRAEGPGREKQSLRTYPWAPFHYQHKNGVAP